jgi:hypothetical protein
MTSETVRSWPGLHDRVSIAPAVAAARAAGRPVVGLESTLISHGLPYPANIEVARRSEAAVRAAGAEPATVAAHDGRLLVGLDDDAFGGPAPAAPGSFRQAAPPTLGAGLAAGGWECNDRERDDDRRPHRRDRVFAAAASAASPRAFDRSRLRSM